MKVKRISAALCAVIMILSLLTPALAAEPDRRIIDLGDGFYIIQTVTQYARTRSGNTIYGEVTNEAYYQNTQIGSATLTASFDISGSTAVAKLAILEGTGINGWTFTNGGTKCSGNKASGTAIFQSGSTKKQFTLSISCTPDGTLS